MTAINVLLEVPIEIQAGLATGAYERVGGVVRETGTNRIVAWLRDGLDTQSDTTNSLSFASHSLTYLMRSGLILNMAISTASHVIILDRLNRLSDNLKALGDELKKEFQQDRDTRFEAALEQIANALEADTPSTKTHSLVSARNELEIAQRNYQENVKKELDEGSLSLAQHYLVRAMYATTSLARTFLETEDIRNARRKLNDSSQQYLQFTRELVRQLLGEHPAIFFHNAVAGEDVQRFISIIEWYEGQDILNVIIGKLRQDFWNQELVDAPFRDLREQVEETISRFRGDTISRRTQRFKQLVDNLSHAEAAIENLRRLQGFDLEVRSLRLTEHTFEQWKQLHSQEEGFAVLMAESPVEV
jgi:hypothetical protein